METTLHLRAGVRRRRLPLKVHLDAFTLSSFSSSMEKMFHEYCFMALHPTAIYFLPSKVRFAKTDGGEICSVDTRPPPVLHLSELFPSTNQNSKHMHWKEAAWLFVQTAAFAKKASVSTPAWSILVSFKNLRDQFLSVTQTTAKHSYTQLLILLLNALRRNVLHVKILNKWHQKFWKDSLNLY